MMNKNEKKMNNATLSPEMTKCERIKDLYRQMLSTPDDEDDYRIKLIDELLRLQKEDGSFHVIDDLRCDSDIRVAYAYEPTYYATAALMYAMNVDGKESSLQDALSKGLAFACGRHLAGHGYCATEQQIEALNIYKKAGLYEFLPKYEKDFPEFNKMIGEIIENYRDSLARNSTISDWMTDFRTQFENEVNDYDLGMEKNVWYACYGSNLSFERFMDYINRCSDTTAPIESRPITIPHNVYFASSSTTWEDQGTAFLDITCPGMAFGRMYLITAAQFAEIRYFEGPKYAKKMQLGMVDGIPIYTLTSSKKRTDIKSPCLLYFNTILTGLKETYTDLSETTLLAYLCDSGIVDADDRKILSFVRNSEHGVTLQSIAEHTVPLYRTKKSVKKLVQLELLKQDHRSIEAGHRLTNSNAVLYTNKKSREVIALLLFINR